MILLGHHVQPNRCWNGRYPKNKVVSQWPLSTEDGMEASCDEVKASSAT